MAIARSRSECASISAAASVLILAMPWPGRGRSFPAAMLACAEADAVERPRALLVTEPTQKRAGNDPAVWHFRILPVITDFC